MNSSWSKLIATVTNTVLNKLQKKSNRNTSSRSPNIGIAVDGAISRIGVNNSDLNFTDIGFAHDLETHHFKNVSSKGIALICGFEGLELQAYDDGTGVCTIGYGTIIYPNGKTVQYGDVCTIEQAQSFMQHDLKRFEQAVSTAVKVPLSQNQFDALVSLTYNIGIGAFRNSTLLKLLNTLDYVGASNQFDVWVKAGGQTVQGLVNRRAVEKRYFLSGKVN